MLRGHCVLKSVRHAGPLADFSTLSLRARALTACHRLQPKGSCCVGSLRKLHSNPQYVREIHTSLPLTEDTVYALSTAQGRAGIAVIRISGRGARDVYHGLCPHKELPRPRLASLRTLFHPVSGEEPEVLDSDALVLFFPGPKSVTGDDILELHVHGGSATVKAVLSAIPSCTSKHSIRYAEPGEFTKRAFLNDRLDLAQVESLSDTLAAETEQQRRAAVRGSTGALGVRYESWRQQLLFARGEIEALIDFSEDQHFDESPTELLQSVKSQVEVMLHSIALHEKAGIRSELLRSGIQIALLGPPNVGKSSLMNQIVGREASIVSPEAGTTRDIVEASLDIKGFLCSFADTAGIRSASQDIPGIDVAGAVEQEGIRRAKTKATTSDIVIVLASIEPHISGGWRIQYDMETLHLAAQATAHLVAINKRDSVSAPQLSELVAGFERDVLGRIPGLEETQPILISCAEAQSPSHVGVKDPGNVHALTEALVRTFTSLTSLPVELGDLLGVTTRQRQLLASCRDHLLEFMREAEGSDNSKSREPDIVLAAEHLRYAAHSLARITGRGESPDVEEVLGVIFEKFCVGK